MGALRKIPKWGWATGAIGLALIALLIYEHRQNQEMDPCDPENPDYDVNVCGAGEDVSQYPPKQSIVPSGASGGLAYYLPLPGGSAPAVGATEGLPEEAGEPEPAPEPELVTSPPSPPVVKPPVSKPPVVGPTITPNGPIYPIGVGPGHPAPPAPPPPVVGPTITPTGPVNPPAVAPAIPAPSGWCGHPNAVGVGQPCGGKFQNNNNPPAGWHWFCCNGALGRAPN